MRVGNKNTTLLNKIRQREPEVDKSNKFEKAIVLIREEKTWGSVNFYFHFISALLQLAFGEDFLQTITQTHMHNE